MLDRIESGLTWAVLAPGESMSQDVASSVQHLPCVAVSDCFTLAPWARALASTDDSWWKVRDTQAFAGRKFSVSKVYGVERVEPRDSLIFRASSSGVLGIYVAWLLGAKRILLLGFDNRGSHFFGPHAAPLKNTSAGRYAIFSYQFEQMRIFLEARNIEIVNCTPDSALNCFKKATLAEALCERSLSRQQAQA